MPPVPEQEMAIAKIRIRIRISIKVSLAVILFVCGYSGGRIRITLHSQCMVEMNPKKAGLQHFRIFPDDVKWTVPWKPKNVSACISVSTEPKTNPYPSGTRST